MSAAGRADRLTERLADAGVDAILVTDLVNVRYLTGYTGSNGLAVIAPQLRDFVTDFRYVEQAADEVYPEFNRRRASQDLLDAVEEALPAGELRLGFEEAHVSVRQHARMRKLFPDRVELVGVAGLVERLRAIKDPDEVAAIRAATELADTAFEGLLRDGLIGRSERELALSLEFRMRELGASRPSFDPIVAGGAHGALPHAQPRDTPISRGELVVIDWGAQLDGYCSDCTRTVAAGEPDVSARTVYQLVLDAQLAGLDAVSAGAPGREVDAGRPRSDRGRRPRRALRPRARARGGTGHPRGAPAGPALGRRPGHRQRGHGRARHLPSGPGRRADRGPGGGRGRRLPRSSPASPRT